MSDSSFLSFVVECGLLGIGNSRDAVFPSIEVFFVRSVCGMYAVENGGTTF